MSPVTGRWNLQLAGAGRFRVEVNLVEGYNRSRRVPYRLRHGGQETDVILDQSTAGGWRALGTFDFQAGDDQWISVYDNTGEEGATFTLQWMQSASPPPLRHSPVPMRV